VKYWQLDRRIENNAGVGTGSLQPCERIGQALAVGQL
jgi:hypothetical protein